MTNALGMWGQQLAAPGTRSLWEDWHHLTKSGV